MIYPYEEHYEFIDPEDMTPFYEKLRKPKV